jgi:hypothetical protein
LTLPLGEAKPAGQCPHYCGSKGDRVMETDSVRRTKLLQQVKRGRQMGAMRLVTLFVMIVASAQLFYILSDVDRGKGSFGLLAAAMVGLFILAIAGIGLSILEMNERFAALIDLMGEDKLLHDS